MNRMQSQVAEFHRAFGVHAGGTVPRALPAELVELRVGLIAEELDELRQALLAGDVVETYDAALDILYVTFGLLDLINADAESGMNEVQASNMSKLGTDGRPILSRGMELDGFPAGKVLKGPHYFKPRLDRVLADQGWVAEPADAVDHGGWEDH
jgi:predicted HAD superfamily Cof-like phosphohydrolase